MMQAVHWYMTAPKWCIVLAVAAGLVLLGNRMELSLGGGTRAIADEAAPIVLAQAPASGANNVLQHPFPRRIPSPSLDGGVAWLNTSKALDLKDLRGKFVVLDFWTYCCINCMHVLPELKKLEKAYPNNVVVIGVHSAKFDEEKDSENIKDAILRYEIEHPVINDAEHVLWQKFGATAWPSLRVIDPQGDIVAAESGEVEFTTMDRFFKNALPFYRANGLLNEEPIKFDLEAHKAETTPLRFPGKVLADEASGRLFITDSNHNRIVISDLNGNLIDTIGSGEMGKKDGEYATAQFDHPQGVALHNDTLYVADTENHLLRKVDLKQKTVTTIAGTGVQSRSPWPGYEQNPLGRAVIPPRFVGPPLKTAIASPWAVLVHKDELYIAMAGPHQIWKMPLDESEIGPYAGNGREDIVDGPLLPKRPYDLGFSSFAQPSGLASDGTWLYVADSEGSSVRAVPLAAQGTAKRVRTIVGTADLPNARLFTFGDVDGRGSQARLQHVLGVTYHEGNLYIADTYNNKIKVIDAEKGIVKSLAGTGEAGSSDSPAQFDEPAGISYAAGKLYVADTNNHLIRVIDLSTTEVSTLEIKGLTPPVPPKKEPVVGFPGATEVMLDAVAVKPTDGVVRVSVNLQLPLGWKINKLAPMKYLVQTASEAGPVDREVTDRMIPLADPNAKFEFELPVSAESGSETLKISMPINYCQEGNEGLCKIAAVAFTVPVTFSEDADADVLELEHTVE